MRITPKCSMLINQNVYIGDDPIGHVCRNDAVYCDGQHFYCSECRDKILSNNYADITIPEYNAVASWHDLLQRRGFK